MFSEFFVILFVDPIRAEVKRRKKLKEQQEREQRLLEELPVSLNPAPMPGAVSGQWRKARASVLETLRFGSVMRDLEPHVDNGYIFATNSKGERWIVARGPGIRGWLRENCDMVVQYKTAMRYKTLAERMRRACLLPREVPLEWIFPDQAEHDAERRKLTNANLAAARARFVALTKGCRFIANLFDKLDIILHIKHWKLSKPRRPMELWAVKEREVRKAETVARNLDTWIENALKQNICHGARRKLAEELQRTAEALKARLYSVTP
jgi:hypothetical protein